MDANNCPTAFTDEDLARVKNYLNIPLGFEDKPVKNIVGGLIARLEAAELVIRCVPDHRNACKARLRGPCNCWLGKNKAAWRKAKRR